jgi:polyisoprenoid-binding protein YceI
MKKHIATFALALSLFFGLSSGAEAKPWIIDYGKSHLGFSAAQGSITFQGHFSRYKVDVDFDPDHPETSKINAVVDISSIGTGDPQRDAMLPQPEWFATAQYPQATFVSTQIAKTGPDSFTAHGTLTIKGKAHPATLPFTLIHEDDHWHSQGKVDILRSDFNIGQGQWSDEKYVKFAVEIKIDIVAKPNA